METENLLKMAFERDIYALFLRMKVRFPGRESEIRAMLERVWEDLSEPGVCGVSVLLH